MNECSFIMNDHSFTVKMASESPEPEYSNLMHARAVAEQDRGQMDLDLVRLSIRKTLLSGPGALDADHFVPRCRLSLLPGAMYPVGDEGKDRQRPGRFRCRWSMGKRGILVEAARPTPTFSGAPLTEDRGPVATGYLCSESMSMPNRLSNS